MKRLSPGRLTAMFLLLAGALALMATEIFGAVEKSADSTTRRSISNAGIELEGARLRSFAELRQASEGMISRLEALQGSGASKDVMARASMLKGEILLSTRQYDSAIEAFHHGRKQLKGGPFEDDLFFSLITAVEGSGSDGEAAQMWNQWAGRFPESALSPEADLASLWNLLRQGKTSEASLRAKKLTDKYSWIGDDQRMILARASIAFATGDHGSAEQILAGTMDPKEKWTDAILMLRGLCYEKLGRQYDAVLDYQRIVRDHPGSRLTGFARLAKGNILSSESDYAAAALDFNKLSRESTRIDIVQESSFLEGLCHFLAGDFLAGERLMDKVAADHPGTDISARARFALGEMKWERGLFNEAIIEFNRLQADHFDHELAGTALYRSARCLDATGRHVEANSTYQAVASGYPYSSEAPAAVYLAGVGLLEQGLPLAAAPYFQLIIDRYWGEDDGERFVFRSMEHQELAEAALCLLEYSYHQTGDMGQLSGAPHLVLHKMPASDSQWRAWALLIDADALAAQGRYPKAQETLARLFDEFPDDRVGIKANRLLAWTYARQGRQDLAIETEERLLARYNAQDDRENMSAAELTLAHAHFNRKDYREAGRRYDEFLRRFPDHPHRRTALFQLGVCSLRGGRYGDAVDAWEKIIALDPTDDLAMKAWRRAGDLYFHTGHFEDARRCFTGLTENSDDPADRATGMLALARCDYNEGQDESALTTFKEVIDEYPGTVAADEARTGAAQTLYRLGIEDSDQARLSELVNDFPDSPLAPDAQYEIGIEHYEAGRYVEAATQMRKMVNLFPTSESADRAWFMMADSYVLADSTLAARRSLEKFLEYFPESGLKYSALFRLGKIRFNGGEYTDAAADFAQVLDADIDQETKYASAYNLAMSYRILGERADAVNVLKEFRMDTEETGDQSAAIAMLLGEILEESEDYSAAEAEYEKLVSSSEEDTASVDAGAELYYRLGLCREKLGRTGPAMQAYRKAMAHDDRTDPYRLSAVARFASLHEDSGDFRGALIAYRDLIENSGDPELVMVARERATEIEKALE